MNEMKIEQNHMLDKVFKRIFCQDTRMSQLVLIDFLNAVLEKSLASPIDEILEKSYFKKYLFDNPQFTMDLKAKTKAKTGIQIKLIIHQEDYFHNRSDCLTFSQVDNKPSPRITKHFIIHILNFNLLQEFPDFHNQYSATPTNYHELTEIHYLELPKLNKNWPQSHLEKWLYFISKIGAHPTPDPLHDLIEKDPLFKLGNHLYRKQHANTRQALVIKEEQQGLNKWMEEAQIIEKERIAIKMIRAGYPSQTIIMLTDLPLEKLEDLILATPLLKD